jgi:hypothetical protein
MGEMFMLNIMVHTVTTKQYMVQQFQKFCYRSLVSQEYSFISWI